MGTGTPPSEGSYEPLPKIANVKENKKIRTASMITNATRSRTQISSSKVRGGVILYHNPRARGLRTSPFPAW